MIDKFETIPTTYNDMDVAELGISDERRSGFDRRGNHFGRRTEDFGVEMTKLEQKIDGLQAQIHNLTLALTRTEVQNEQIRNLVKVLEDMRKTQDAQSEKILELQQAHDRCGIDALIESVAWIKHALVTLITIAISSAGGILMYLISQYH